MDAAVGKKCWMQCLKTLAGGRKKGGHGWSFANTKSSSSELESGVRWLEQELSVELLEEKLNRVELWG